MTNCSGVAVTVETRTYRLDWELSVRMWVVRRGDQPVAWFDGEDLELGQEFVVNMNAEDLDKLLSARSQAF